MLVRIYTENRNVTFLTKWIDAMQETINLFVGEGEAMEEINLSRALLLL